LCTHAFVQDRDYKILFGIRMNYRLLSRLFGIIIFLQLTLPATAQNQAVDYLFNRTVEPYVPLENDTTLGSGSQDDVVYMSKTSSQQGTTGELTGEGFPIGFPFVFDGATFTRWGFSSNGYIKLGNGTFTIRNSLSSAFSSTFDSTQQVNLISALHGDIMMTDNQGSFRYRTIGSPGARILVVEYRSMKHYNGLNPASEEIFNFQIRLHEGSNKVSFIYGPFLKDEVSRTYAVGIRGKFFNNIHLRSLPASAGSWSESTRGQNSGANMAANLNLLPTSGLVFNFIPRAYENDLAMEEILAPVSGLRSCPLTTTEQVRVKIKNGGTLSQTTAKIGYKVGNAAPVIQDISLSPALAPQASREFTFTANANLSGIVPPQMKVWVFIPNEEEGSRNNDTTEVRFVIGRPLPLVAVNSFDSLVNQNGWLRGRGATAPSGTFSLWKPQVLFSGNTSMLEMRSDTPAVKNEWFYSPGYKVDSAYNYSVNFQAALLSGLTGTSALASMGDDTIKLMYSTDCRQTWRTLRVFNNADLTSGTIDNTIKSFSAILPGSVKNLVTFGFFGKNNGNAFAQDYRFVFRQFVLSKVARFDLSADTVRVPSVVSLSCKYSSQELLTIRVTNRGIEPLDSTEAGFFINGGFPIRRKFAFSPALQPGASAVLEFSGIYGADLSVPEGQSIVGFVNPMLQSVEQRNNDTVRRSYNLIAPLTIPTPVYQAYANMLGARWQRGRGISVPSGGFSFWGAKAVGTQATIGVDFAGSPSSLNEWFYSASYTGPSRVNLIFKAAVTEIGGVGPAAGMNEDTLKVMYSLDCGATWSTLKKFSQADLTSGAINNTLQEFSYELVSSRGSILVGFAGFRSATAPVANGFTFHVDSLTLAVPTFPDISGTNALIGLRGLPSCPSSNSIALGVIVRNAGTQPITNATVGYTVNNGAPVTVAHTFQPPLAQGATDTVEFLGSNAPVYANSGTYTVKGFAKMVGESGLTAFNDTSGISMLALYGEIPVPYTENFANSGLLPKGWTSDTLSGKGFRLTAGRGVAGGQAMSFRSQPSSNRAQVLTRNYGPIQASTPFLSIAYRSQEQSGAFFRLRPSDFIDVMVSTDCGANFTAVGRIDSLNQVVASGFINHDFDISAFANQNLTVKIDAKLTPKAFSSNFLDIVRMSFGQATDAEELLTDADAGFVVYPNPSETGSTLNIRGQGQIRHLMLVTMDGRQLQPTWKQIQPGQVELDLGQVPASLYMLRILSDKQAFNQLIQVR
jgi:hypothetical protein